MAVKSNNVIGNKYHDEETGEFTSADSVGIENENDNDIPSFLKPKNQVNSGSTSLFDKIKAQRKAAPKKKITEMSEEELDTEITENIKVINAVGASIVGNFLDNDKRIKCDTLRGIVDVINKYKVNINGMKIHQTTSMSYNATTEQEFIPIMNLSALISPKVDFQMNANVNIRFNIVTRQDYDDLCNHQRNVIARKHNSYVNDEYLASYDSYHEMGHVLMYSMIYDYVKSKNAYGKPLLTVNNTKTKDGIRVQIDNVTDGFAENFRKEVYNEYIKNYPDVTYPQFCNKVSLYGRTNVQEWFAEKFTQLNCGQADDVSKALGVIIERRGYKK